MGFLSPAALAALGFGSVGRSVFISDLASFHGAERIHIGSHVRIDDFVVMSAGAGGIQIGDYIHLAVGVNLIGAAPISLGDFCNLSGRVSVYSSNDDYSGNSLTNPMVPLGLRNVNSRPVRNRPSRDCRFWQRGAARCHDCRWRCHRRFSLLKEDVPRLAVYGGAPAKKIGQRSPIIFELEEKLSRRDLISDGLKPSETYRRQWPR